MLTPQVASNVIFAAAFFVLSILTFNYFNKDIDAVPVKKKSITALTGTSRRSWERAIAWKEFVYNSGGKKYVIGKFVFYGILLIVIAWLSDFQDMENFGGFIAAIMFYGFIPLEITNMVSNMFPPEIKGKTLSTLMLLPMSAREICWAKLQGGLIGIIPSASYLLLGLLLSPGISMAMLRAIAEDPLEISTVILIFAGELCLFWHLVVAFSLLMNGWWAICLSLLGQYFGNLIFFMLMAMLFFNNNGSGSWILLSLFSVAIMIGISIALHVWIIRQLPLKAASD